MKLLFFVFAPICLSSALYGYLDGPEIRRTGAPADGGENCTGCHTSFAPANSDSRGYVAIETANYRPGVKQVVQVIVRHPEGKRWGFQLTARTVNDPTRQAGFFSPTQGIRVRCDPSGEAPCNGSREFASHRATSVQDNVAELARWLVEWTPPGDDAGDIVFYVAGNAASDPLNSNQGDRIYTNVLTIANEGSCALPRKPLLRNLYNGASFRPEMSMNTMVSVFGMDFQVGGIKRSVTYSDLVGGKYPTEFACVAVEIAGRRAPITYVQTDQINAQVPSETPPGPVNVRVLLNPGWPNELRSDVATVTFQNYSPALFTFLPGSGVAAVFAESGIPVDPAHPAAPGDVVSVYGTGFGPSEPVYQAGEIPDRSVRLRETVRVILGGVQLSSQDVLYSGLTPQAISGLYQFNIRIPSGTPSGQLPFSIELGSARTQAGVTIPVAPRP